jgi:hypothetical protein
MVHYLNLASDKRRDHGTAATREEAMTKFRAALGEGEGCLMSAERCRGSAYSQIVQAYSLSSKPDIEPTLPNDRV